MEARANVKRLNVNVIKCTCSIGDSRLKDIAYSPLYKMSPKPVIPNQSAHICVALHNKYMILCVYKRQFHLCGPFLPKKTCNNNNKNNKTFQR